MEQFEEDRAAYIRSQLSTRPKWTKGDYEDFYEQDVQWLLAEVERLRRIVGSGERIELKDRDGNVVARPFVYRT
jgi:hypothetical protein